MQRDVRLSFVLENEAQLPFRVEELASGRGVNIVKSNSIDFRSQQFFSLVVKITDESLRENNVKFVEIIITVDTMT